MQIERITLHLSPIGRIDNVVLFFFGGKEVDISAIGITLQNPPSCGHVGGYIEVILFVSENAGLFVFCTEAQLVGADAAVYSVVPALLSRNGINS